MTRTSNQPQRRFVDPFAEIARSLGPKLPAVPKQLQHELDLAREAVQHAFEQEALDWRVPWRRLARNVRLHGPERGTRTRVEHERWIRHEIAKRQQVAVRRAGMIAELELPKGAAPIVSGKALQAQDVESGWGPAIDRWLSAPHGRRGRSILDGLESVTWAQLLALLELRVACVRILDFADPGGEEAYVAERVIKEGRRQQQSQRTSLPVAPRQREPEDHERRERVILAIQQRYLSVPIRGGRGLIKDEILAEEVWLRDTVFYELKNEAERRLAKAPSAQRRRIA